MDNDNQFLKYQQKTADTNHYSPAISERIVSTIFGDNIADADVLKVETIKAEYNIMYLVLGLLGEAGEVAEKFKKHLRDKSLEGKVFLGDEDFRKQVALELGDVCWYVARLADLIGYDY
ncbi:MAG: nucleoside triphosphate pyrophosphohydrolase family protein, partial [Waterburya sp.]